MESQKHLELITVLSSVHSNLQNLQNNMILLTPLVALTSLQAMDKQKGQCDLTLFKHQQEKYAEIEANLISTLPLQQTLNQLQTAVVL